MKQKLTEFLRTASAGWRPLVAAIALIFTLGVATTMVSAQSETGAAGFNSPLAGPGAPHGGNLARDRLDGIVDVDELMAEAMGITVEELDAAKEAGTRIDELIDELGLDADTVRQAVQDAVEAAVEQAVADGLLTAEEAEAVLNPPAGPGQVTERIDPLEDIVDRDALLADALGITVEELDAAKETGTRIDALVDELGLDAETVRQTVEDATQAAIEQAVADGLLTEEEAEALLDRSTGPQERAEPGMQGGRGGRGSGEMPVPNDDASASSQSLEQPGRAPLSGGPGGPGGRR